MSLSCGEARRLLWPEDGPQILTEELARAQDHLQACESCLAFMRDMDVMSQELRAAAPDVSAPLAVRNRLYSAVARARTSAPPHRVVSRRNRWIGGVAAAVLVVGGVWASLRLSGSSADPFAPLAAEHAHADGGDGIESSDPSTVSAWLSSRVTFAARVPRFDNAVLEGARLCMSQCGQGVVMHYRHETGMVSYYVVPQDDLTSQPTPFEELDRSSRSGYRIVSWREPGLLHVMVGNVSEPLLTDLAHSCRTQFIGRRPDPVGGGIVIAFASVRGHPGRSTIHR